MEVIIMRGLPGSGKSTWVEAMTKTAKELEVLGSVVVCSADDFHKKEGVYQFDPRNAGQAHLNCLEQFLRAVSGKASRPIHTLVVDNTNTTASEISPYYQLALMHRVERVRIVRIHVPIEICLMADRNTHKVPDRTMWSMWHNLQHETLPPWWTEDTIVGNWIEVNRPLDQKQVERYAESMRRGEWSEKPK